MDAFELLKNDHKKVSQLFKQIESASGQAKRQLFSQVKSELDVHAHIEETIFYPALENTEEARDITLEAYEEHKVVKELLAELANGNAPDDEWDAKFKVLKENVEHHVEEEEGELFDKAEDALGEEEIERLGDEMAAEKTRQGGGNAGLPRGTTSRKAAGSKRATRDGGKSRPGVLKRLAGFVGLGESQSRATKTSGKRSSKSAGSKKAGSKAGTKKAAKKAASKSATTGGKRAAARRGASKKTSSKTGGARKGGSKKSGRSAKKSRSR